MKPGSWLWGLQFAVLHTTIEGVTAGEEQTHWSVVIRQGSELPFMDRPIAGSEIFSGVPNAPFNTLTPPVNLLPKPRLIIPPAQLHVEISNDADPTNEEFAISCQLLLLFAEPKA